MCHVFVDTYKYLLEVHTHTIYTIHRNIEILLVIFVVSPNENDSK